MGTGRKRRSKLKKTHIRLWALAAFSRIFQPLVIGEPRRRIEFFQISKQIFNGRSFTKRGQQCPRYQWAAFKLGSQVHYLPDNMIASLSLRGRVRGPCILKKNPQASSGAPPAEAAASGAILAEYRRGVAKRWTEVFCSKPASHHSRLNRLKTVHLQIFLPGKLPADIIAHNRDGLFEALRCPFSKIDAFVSPFQAKA